jgi:hypothetical protein
LTLVRRRFDASPLNCVYVRLSADIATVHQSYKADHTSSDHVDAFATYVNSALALLPTSFGDRFTFDAQLIAALADELSQGQVKLSAMLVPKPSHSWGHQTVPMPTSAGQPAHLIDVIHLPGEDAVDDIDLLAYPFLCHELGHNILFRHGDEFARSFGASFAQFLAQTQQQGLAMRGHARKVGDETIGHVRNYWTPTSDHYNWAHETAVDVIALWTCGPAYLAAIQDVLEDDGLDPYQLGQSHPPYALRSAVLIQAAARLDWAYYTGPLQQLLDGWPKSKRADNKSNLHIACSDSALTASVIDSAIQTCERLGLSRCTPESIATVRQKLSRSISPELGAETLLAAWIIRGDSTEADYLAWERHFISGALAAITE